MARKRKADKTFSQPENKKATKYDIEETFNDSEDEFYAGRDKVLLDETADSKRRRRLVEQEKDLQPSDEEVLGYEDTDEEEDLSEENIEDGEDNEDDYQKLNARSKGGRKATDGDASGDEESEEENWGTNRADYYNADVIETEADALDEEIEARRLHQKQLKNMTEADFGFDEDAWTEQKKETKKGRSITEKLPEAQIPENATEQQKVDILKSRYPELQPLAEDFERLQKVKQELDAEVAFTERKVKEGVSFSKGLPVAIKRNALTAYLATISMYFAIMSSTITKELGSQTITAMPPIQLHEHAIIQSLTRARQIWDRVEHVEIAEPLPSDPIPVRSLPKNRVQEHEDLRDGIEEEASFVKSQKKKSAKEPLRDLASKKAAIPKDDSTVTKKKKSKSKPASKFNDAALQALMSATNRNAAATSEESDIGEEQPLTATEAAEKQRKRKSLRFYTSQIAAKANKRGHASRDAGGDDDLPYKERARDRVERLNREAVARGHAKGDADLDDEPATGAEPTGRQTTSDGEVRYDINDQYYDNLLDAQAQKKADKKAKAEAYAEAAKQGAEVYEEETVGADGKRAITYAIAKNKGLAPKRKKEVRNPRVKKRKKFDEKMKKLGSIRQVYKGGEGRGGYGGELTGIKTNVVKSIKL